MLDGFQVRRHFAGPEIFGSLGDGAVLSGEVLRA